MTYRHRPLQDGINTFIDAGFRIKVVTEPPPAANTPAELLPNADGRSFICFLFFDPTDWAVNLERPARLAAIGL